LVLVSAAHSLATTHHSFCAVFFQSPRKTQLLSSARGFKSTTAYGLTEHQLMLADLFKTPRVSVPEGEPKNIEVLQRLATPLARHKVSKFAEEEEREREAAKKAPKPHDLPEVSSVFHGESITTTTTHTRPTAVR